MVKTIKCPICGEDILVLEEAKTVQCVCGKKYNNPYYNEISSVDDNRVDNSKETLINLLTLRTSVYGINEEVGKIKSEQYKLQKLQSSNDEMRAAKDREIGGLRMSKRSNDDVVKEYLSNKQSKLKQESQTISENTNKKEHKFTWIFVCVVAGIIGFLVFVIFAGLICNGIVPYPFPFGGDGNIALSACEDAGQKTTAVLNGSTQAFVLGLIVAAGLSILGILGLNLSKTLISTSGSIKQYKVEHQMNNYSSTKEYDIDTKKLIAENEYRNRQIDSEIMQLVTSRDNASKQRLAEINKMQNSIHLLRKNANKFLTAVEQEYNNLLTVSDWENLDYIIYLFVTRRADSMKEALHLLDEQKRTEMIVETLESSSNYLAQHISGAISQLGNNLKTEFEKVNRSLNQIHKDIVAASDRAHNDSVALNHTMLTTQMLMTSFAMQSNEMMSNISSTLKRNTIY